MWKSYTLCLRASQSPLGPQESVSVRERTSSTVAGTPSRSTRLTRRCSSCSLTWHQFQSDHDEGAAHSFTAKRQSWSVLEAVIQGAGAYDEQHVGSVPEFDCLVHSWVDDRFSVIVGGRSVGGDGTQQFYNCGTVTFEIGSEAGIWTPCEPDQLGFPVVF